MRNDQAYQQKTEIFFVYEEKKFGKIDSRISELGKFNISTSKKYVIYVGLKL